MKSPRIGIIGGTGLGEEFSSQVRGETITVDTPFGKPSSPILVTTWEGVEIAFISRHGPGHLLNPSIVPYRANIFALKNLGITHILASGATGSLREEIEPGHLVICDQVIDKTHKRASTFFDEGVVGHVEFSEPFCERLRLLLLGPAERIGTHVHPRGTYVCMEGPQFSSKAESVMHRMWGGDLIGMTVMPEAKLAREAEISYALIGLPTDYDCWRPHEDVEDSKALLEEIIGNLKRATAGAIELLRLAVPAVAEHLDERWPAHDALRLAIWSDKTKVDRGVVEKLQPILGRYFT